MGMLFPPRPPRPDVIRRRCGTAKFRGVKTSAEQTTRPEGWQMDVLLLTAPLLNVVLQFCRHAFDRWWEWK